MLRNETGGSPGMLGSPARSARLRNAGVDRQGVDAARHQGVQGIIYEAMAGNAAEAFEVGAGDRDAEVTPLARTRVTDVEVAVVDDFERLGCERSAQRRLDVGGRDAHRESGPAPAAGNVTGAPGASFGASSSCRNREM